MSNNTLLSVTAGAFDPGYLNQYFQALINDVIGRNSLGAVEAGKKLGTQAVPWGEVHTRDLYLGGKLFDPTNLASAANGVVSGKTRTDSRQPDFIRAAGTSPGFSVLGAEIPLSVNISALGVSVQSDLSLGSLVTAPSANNTALVNDTSLGGALATKYAGENGTSIVIDSVGTEISDRAGQFVALRHGAAEIMLARVDDVNTGAATAVLKNVFRGYFFDPAGAPIVREVMSNNNILTLYQLAWVFLQNDGTTLDVSYRQPIWSHEEPSTPQVDDYWFDLAAQVWKRYNGTLYEIINRLLIGLVVMDGANCIAARSIDFSKSYSDLISLEVQLKDATHVSSLGDGDFISVYGIPLSFGQSSVVWSITDHLEADVTEANNTLYFLYVTEKGKPVLSIEHPYNRTKDLLGYYHPYHSWRYVGVVYNDGSGNFSSANSHNSNQARIDVFHASGEFLALPNKSVRITVTGGGGGGSSHQNNGSNGGTSSFGALISASGGGGASISGTGGGGGTGGAGGDENLGSSGGLNVGSNISGSGGASFYGGGGKDTANGAGVSAIAPGAGGGGMASPSNGFGAGGGSAQTRRGVFNSLFGRYGITIGSGGSGGTSGAFNGGSGAGGKVVVEYL